jgi:DNA-binding CsgD family transcriptional regulator
MSIIGIRKSNDNEGAPDEGVGAQVESLLSRVQTACDDVEAFLDTIGAPAFIVDEEGAVAHANRQGRHLLTRERGAVVQSLADAVRTGCSSEQRQKAGAWELRPVDARESQLRTLAILRTSALPTRLRDPLSPASRKWQLTSRQSQVLDLVARGLTNELIAQMLSISKATVEYHLKVVFDKAGVSNRATLIVRLRDLE